MLEEVAAGKQLHFFYFLSFLEELEISRSYRHNGNQFLGIEERNLPCRRAKTNQPFCEKSLEN